MKHEDCWSYVSFAETAATRAGCSSLNCFIYSTNGISYSHTGHKSAPSVISLEPLDGNDTQNKGVIEVNEWLQNHHNSIRDEDTFISSVDHNLIFQVPNGLSLPLLRTEPDNVFYRTADNFQPKRQKN